MKKLSALFLASALLPSCASAPVAPPAPRPAATPSVAQQPSAPPGPTITLFAAPQAFEPARRVPFATSGAVAKPGEMLADWLEPAYESDDQAPSVHVAAAGLRAALLRRGGALYGVHLDRGATGPLAVPEGVLWVGVDGEDAVFAARADGKLFRAGDLGRATDPAGFAHIATIPDATVWDATERLLVAAGGHSAFASTDGGRSFRWASLPDSFVAAQIAARPDGTVVILGHEGGDARRPLALISNDRGASFHPSAFHPYHLWREGARIRGERGECSGTLSTDGASWSADPGKPAYPLHEEWQRMLGLGSTRNGTSSQRALGVRDPEAPSPPTAKTRVGPACPVEEAPARSGGAGGLGGVGIAQGLGGIGLSGGMRMDLGIFGIEGGAPRPPAEARTAWGLLGDGACNGAHASGTQCQADGPYSRVPRPARVDRREDALVVLDAPAGCTPDRVLSARGTAVLVCAKDRGARAVYLAGRDGRWYGEGAIQCYATHLDLLGAEPDGTLALSCGRPDERGFALWVRRPAPLGAPDAIRQVQVPDAVAYRLLAGGRIAAITTRGKPEGISIGRRGLSKSPPASSRERHTFSVVLDGPASQTVLARDLFVAEDVVAFAARGDDLYFGLGRSRAPRFVKLDQGRLVSASAAEVPADIRPEAPRTPSPSTAFEMSVEAPHALAADATHVYFTDTDAGLVLRVPKRGGRAEVLARGLAGPFAVAVDDQRLYVTTLGRAYGEGGGVLALPKSGGAITALAEGLVRAVAVAADAEAVYWLEEGLGEGANGALFSLAKGGGKPTKLLDRLASPRSIALDGPRILVGPGDGEIVAVPRSGGAPQRVGTRGHGVPAIVVAKGGPLWIAGDQAAVVGGTGEIVARAPFLPDALAVAGDEIWLLGQAGGELARTHAGQGKSEIVAEDLVAPTSLVIDDAAVYVREHDGRRLQRFARTGGRGTALYERK